jgi:MoxR-like ATPase
MNIPNFARVLDAILRQNVAMAQSGGQPRDYLVPMAWGDPGLGKTEIVESVAAGLGDLGRDLVPASDEDSGWRVIFADLQTRDPADLGGLPWIADGRAIRCRPDWLPTAGRGILFLDELPQAGLTNMNIAASLIRDHRIGEHALPPTWMVVCAGNHQHNRAGTTTMPTHVRNRLVHLTIEADVNAWAAWAARRGIAPMLVAYNRYRAAEYHHRFSATDNAYPSPRSWSMADRVLQLDLPEALQRECVSGAVGSPASADFTGFQQVFRSLPDVDAILLNPDAGPLPQDAMTSYALMGALAWRATPRNFAAVVRYLDRLPEQEFSVACVVDATARDEQLTMTTAYQTWAAAHGTMLSGH